MDFYLPLRGNLRRKGSTDSSQKDLDEAQIEKEIIEIERHYDFDNPSAIDWDLLVVSFMNLSYNNLQKGLQLLIEGKPFNKPIYDDHLKIRLEKTERVYPSNLIILEGHLIFNN